MNHVKCNLCGATRDRLLFYNHDRLLQTDQREFAVVRCESCGLTYLNPQPTQEELRKYYPDNYGPYANKAMFKHGPMSRLVKMLFSWLRHPRSHTKPPVADSSVLNCLDFGCGKGTFLEGLKVKHPAWKLFGLDNSQIACALTREKGFEVYCGDVAEVDLPKGFFDRVYMNSVIEHLNDPKTAMLRLRAAMKNGAEVVIQTPNIGSLAARLFGRFWYAADTPRHLYLFTPHTLRRLLADTGFTVLEVGYKPGMSVEIKSFFYLLDKKDRRMNPVVWRLLRPVS